MKKQVPDKFSDAGEVFVGNKGKSGEQAAKGLFGELQVINKAKAGRQKTGNTEIFEKVVFPADITKYLAGLFKEVRQEIGLTQEEMATGLGTLQRVYQRWETGNTQPIGEFTAKLFFLRDFLRELANPVTFDTPNEIAKQILADLGTQQDLHILMREMASPVVILVKNLLLYSQSFGHIRDNKLERSPFFIEWLPDTPEASLSVKLSFDGKRKISVLEAHNVKTYTDFDQVKVLVYRPGKWVYALEQAVMLYKSHSYIGIVDDPFLPEMLKAFGLDEK